MKEAAEGCGLWIGWFPSGRCVCRFHLLALGVERDSSSSVSKAVKHQKCRLNRRA